MHMTERHIPILDDPGFNILGLTTTERKILIVTWKTPKSLTAISHLTQIPVTSLHYSLKKLQSRSLIRHMKKTPSLRYRKEPSKTGGSWKSDVIRAIRALQKLTGGRLS